MNFSDPDFIEKVHDLAKSFTQISDIAVLCECDEDRLRDALADPEHPITLAYLRGRAETALSIRRQEINMAVNGSPIAVSHAAEYLKDMLNNE